MQASDASAALKGAMSVSIVLTELQHTRAQLRFVAGLLACLIVFNLVDPAVVLATGTQSLLYRAATATSLGPKGVAVLFGGLAVCLVPFLVMQFGCWEAAQRAITKAACWALMFAGILWFFLAWRCLHLDLGAVPPALFARNGAGAWLFALAIALSLNAEQLRNLMERPA